MQLVAQKLLGGLTLEFDVPTPKPYQELAEACLASDPKQRPTFDKVLAELEHLQGLLDQGGLQAADFSVWPDPSPCMQDVADALKQAGHLPPF